MRNLSWIILPLQTQKTKQNKKKKKRKEKLLGIIFDDRMKFQYHIETCARKRA